MISFAGWLRRPAFKAVHHASWVLPAEWAPWADATRRELHCIEDDRAALRWVAGCVVASYTKRLLVLPRAHARHFLKPVGATFALMLGLVLALAGHARGQTDAFIPAFEETTCALPGMSPDIGSRLRCGTISVPRDYDHPGGGTFKLAIVVIHPLVQEPQADPVLFIQGGPGSPLTIHAARIAHGESATLARNRDLILVDQRGAGRSEPALCPDLSRQQLGVFAHEGSPDDILAAWRGTYSDCRRQLARNGIDPAWFGTSVTVRDLEIVRRTLGVPRWNIYGRSYGTEVVMTLVALYPNTLRAVVLDSVYPPDPLPLTRTQTFDAALEALFQACRSDPSCAAAHPDLATTYREAMAALATAPLTITLPPGSGSSQIVLGPAPFRAVVDLALYYRRLLAMLPRMIQSVHDRDAASLKPFVAHLTQQFVTESPGDAVVVECRDRPGLQALPATSTGVDGPGIIDIQGICRGWIAPGPPASIASATSIPTLLLTGTIDPVTPPPFARIVAAKMGSRAHVVEFPYVGHDIEESTPCGASLVTQFILSPEAPLNTACVAEVPPVAFR
jgi:pimeloyl-ACP methyl ester carboxylesterase